MRRARGVAHGVGQRLLRDADDLALDGVADSAAARRARSRSAPRWSVGAESAMRRSADARSSPPARFGRSAPTERRASMMWLRASSTAVSSFEATAGGSVQASRCARLQLHQDGGEALRQLVVDVARQPVALLEDRLAPLLDRRCARPAGSGAAPASPAAPCARSSATRHSPSHGEVAPVESAIHPSVWAPSTSGATASESTPTSRLNARTASGRRGSSPRVLGVSVHPAVCANRCVRHARARQRQRAQSGLSRVNRRSSK